MDSAARILLIRLKSIGDVLFTLPAVNLVRDHFPDARLVFLVSRENELLVRGFRAVDEIITLDRSLYKRRNPWMACAESIRLIRRLRREKFALTVDFQGYGETGWLAWLSGARRRWGSVYRRGRRWAYTRGVTRDDRLHPAQWNLSLLHQCGLRPGPIRNEFALPEGALSSAKALFTERGLDPAKPVLYLQPFTSAAHKNWPLENYLALAEFWRERGVQVMLGGGPADRPMLEAARTDQFILTAGVPRATDMGLLGLSTLIVGGDTGFLHLAVAMGKRVLMLARRGSPDPLGHPDWKITPPGDLPAANITLEEVLRATTGILALTRRVEARD